MSLPEYYSKLGPFQDHFQEGHPILCYHKISRVPRQARIKGLYLAPNLFRQQITEIAQAGLTSTFLLGPAFPPGRTISITFDDGFLNNLTTAVPLLAEARLQAINYLVADRLGQTSDWEAREGGEADPLMNESQIKDWLAAGHQIGAHTCTHPRLASLSPAMAKEEISASKKKLEDRFGLVIEHFAYPFGDYNERTVALVGEAGFKTAVTMHRGINTPTTPPLILKRWSARYPTRTLKNLFGLFSSGW